MMPVMSAKPPGGSGATLWPAGASRRHRQPGPRERQPPVSFPIYTIRASLRASGRLATALDRAESGSAIEWCISAVEAEGSQCR